ncbi:serpin A3-3 [Etheostoma spectabile]|uniref:serpin A3-3 n=1 Tax=Etheostoma spectabile TaxID=54343 RepID=UPI0013AF80C7|nr:serpin A3-3-like [Etheostoma spectabile]
MMMMRTAVVLWVLSAVICVESANSVSLVNDANREFSFSLYRKLAAHADSQGQNILFSPICVSTALAALSVGAQGRTLRQIFNGLGFSNSLTQKDVNQAFKTLLQGANNPFQGDSSEGTAVYLDNRFRPKREFLQTLKQSYYADGFNVDFTKAEQSAETINEYVAEKTNGKIDQLVENLDPSTVMYLISYIYYKGTWATRFDPNLTEQDHFHVDDDTQVPVLMMNMEASFRTYRDLKLKTTILQLPFTGSYSMLLMMPDDMATLEDNISQDLVSKWLKARMETKPRRQNVYIPKFSIKTSYNLNDVLSEMGMTDMFSDRANFRGISEVRGLLVSEVLHQATLDVDETGAEATAVSAARPELTSIGAPVLKFNRPFMVIIIEFNTEKILFMGKIIDPTL